MTNRGSDQPLKAPEANEKSRREFLKGSAVGRRRFGSGCRTWNSQCR